MALVGSGLRGVPLVAYGWWASLSVALLFIDLAVQRLPARLSHTATVGLLAGLLMDAQVHDGWDSWIRAVLGALVAGGLLAVWALLRPALVGWGDVRFALAIGAATTWVSWLALYTAAFLSSLAAALVGAHWIITRRANLTTPLPQGPFLYAGAISSVLLLFR